MGEMDLKLVVDNTIHVDDETLSKSVPVKNDPTLFLNKIHKSILNSQSVGVLNSSIQYKHSINSNIFSNSKTNRLKNYVYNGEQIEYNKFTTHPKLEKVVNNLEINSKEYVDLKIDSLEKSINIRLDSQDKLFTEKIDHLHTKIDSTLDKKFNEFKKSMEQEKKESRKYLLNTVISTVAIAVAVIGVLITWLT